tara:strand:+ start:895 stop:1131 length:237 start_codon:yes stop_codon:yes gene_type:complete
MTQPSNSTVEKVKEWITLSIAIVTCIAGIIFWVQSASNSKFERVEKQISELKAELNQIRQDNNKILRVVGRLEGRLNN